MKEPKELRELKGHHLIDGKGLKEDCLERLRANLEWLIKDNVAERLQHLAFPDMRRFLAQFEDECVSYDRSKNFVSGENDDLDDEDEALDEKDALNPRILVLKRDYSHENDKTVLPVELGEVWLDNHGRKWLISKMSMNIIYGIREGEGKTRECTWMPNGGGNYGFSRLVKKLESSRLREETKSDENSVLPPEYCALIKGEKCQNGYEHFYQCVFTYCPFPQK